MIRTGAISLVLAVLVAAVHAHDFGQSSGESLRTAADLFVHTPPGADSPGTHPEPFEGEGAALSVRVIDDATNEPTFCRVNVRGLDGQYYEPADNVLAPWSLHRLGNRISKGPFRYYGWFFYSDGAFEVDVPSEEIVIEVWKGFEYRPVVQRVDLHGKTSHSVELRLQRTLNMAERGWYAGDPHLHLNRRNAEDEARALDLMEAEDVQFGHLLAMNETSSYTGEMSAQEWPPSLGLGPNGIATRGRYALTSGQEYRNSTYGHILLLLIDDLVFRGQSFDPNVWPLFNEVGRAVRRMRGFSVHAHGGYEKEIWADVAHGNTDGVELLQFAVYRGVGLEGWYHMLNAGFDFPAIGASDYPYCRALGDCRTYARVDVDLNVAAWTGAAVGGKSFVTTGPMLFLHVWNAQPGDTVNVDENTTTAKVRVEVMSEVSPIKSVDIIANGEVVESFPVEDTTLPQRMEFLTAIPCEGSMWVAARASGERLNGHPDAEAHTNPVYVYKENERIVLPDSVSWLLKRVQERRAANAERDFDRREDVLRFFDETVTMLQKRLESTESS